MEPLTFVSTRSAIRKILSASTPATDGSRVPMTEELRGILPGRFVPFLFPLGYHQVISDWLLWEILQHAEEQYPVLRELAGWRRQDVIVYLDALKEMRDRRVAEAYGRPGAVI